jgi:hypothetical protein
LRPSRPQGLPRRHLEGRSVAIATTANFWILS